MPTEHTECTEDFFSVSFVFSVGVNIIVLMSARQLSLSLTLSLANQISMKLIRFINCCMMSAMHAVSWGRRRVDERRLL